MALSAMAWSGSGTPGSISIGKSGTPAARLLDQGFPRRCRRRVARRRVARRASPPGRRRRSARRSTCCDRTVRAPCTSRCADQVAASRLAAAQAEVEDPRSQLGVEQDVCRLEVAVLDAQSVRVVDRLGDLGHDPRPLGDTPASARCVPARSPRRTPSSSTGGSACAHGTRRAARCAGRRTAPATSPRAEGSVQVSPPAGPSSRTTLAATVRPRVTSSSLKTSPPPPRPSRSIVR